MRTSGIVLLIVGALLAATVAMLWWYPAAVLAFALRTAGLTMRFEDLRLDAGSVEVTGLRAARVWVRYRPADLLRGRLAHLEIDGLQLRGRLVDGRIELPGLPSPDPGGSGDLPALPWPETITLQDARVQLATPWGELHAPLVAELQATGATAAITVEMHGGELINDAGRLQADLVVTGSAPLTPGVALQEVAAKGRLELAAGHFALPALASGVDGRAAVAFDLADGRLEARLDTGALEVAELAPALAPWREPLPPPWRIDLHDPARPLQIGAELTDGSLALEIDGALRLTAGPAAVGIDLTARLEGDDRGGLSALDGRAGIELSALRWASATLDQGTLELAGTGSLETWRGTLAVDLAGSGRPSAGIALAGVSLRHDLGLRFADRALVVSAHGNGALAIERCDWQGAGWAGPLGFALAPQEEPLLVASFPTAGGLSWRQRLHANGQAFDFAAPSMRGRAELAELTVALEGDRDGLTAGRATLAGGRLRLPAQQLTLAGIAIEAVLAPDGLAPTQAIPLTVETISHGATPAWFAPLGLRGTLRPQPDALEFDLRLSPAAGTPALTLRGRHGLANGRGRAEVALTPVTFAPGQLQPRTLAPVAGNLLTDVAGTLALNGTLGWDAGAEVTTDLALLVDDLAFTAGPARLSQVDGVIAVDRLWPLATPPAQQLAIGLVDLGLPLTRGLLTFQLLPDSTLAIERLRWDFAGGTVAAAPFTVGSAASDIILTLNAERLDLGQLFALTKLDGLSGEGSIGGTLPIRISGAEAVIEGGELRAAGPGWLRYRADAVPDALRTGDENVSLLLQALENFRYEALRITLDGRTDAEMDIGLHVKGANPDLYDGYPIEFNLDLEGKLANILRSALASYQIPERIRERMQGFRR